MLCGRVLGIGDGVEVFGNAVPTSVHNEDMKDVELDALAHLLGLEECTRDTMSADGKKNE
jgi:hypothetical protein